MLTEIVMAHSFSVRAARGAVLVLVRSRGHRAGAAVQEQATGTWVSEGTALHSCSESSAVEPGEGQMGNVGLESQRRAMRGIWMTFLLAVPVSAQPAAPDAVPTCAETPLEVVVSGRTSTLKSITIVHVGDQIPETYAGDQMTNTPGFTWYVSRHFALKTDLSEEDAHSYLTIAELAYPHYKWVIGKEPPDIDRKRLPFVYARSLERMQEAAKSDLGEYISGPGGGVTMDNNVAYNFPSGGLKYHRRDLVMHENLHVFHNCTLGVGEYHMPGRFTEGVATAFANHVYDEKRKQLTVMVLDKATENNPYDLALRDMRNERFLTMQDFIEHRAGDDSARSLYTQFFWTDPDRLMKWRLWRDELADPILKGEELHQRDIQLMEEIFGSIEALNAQWERWVADRRSTFTPVSWGWEQDGDTLWSHGFGEHRHSRTDINYAPNEPVTFDPLRMDYPAEPMPSIVGPVARGVDEPSVACVVDFRVNPSQGYGGLGLAVQGDRLIAVVCNENRELVIDAGDYGKPRHVFPFPETLISAIRESGHRVGFTITIAQNELKVSVRAAKSDAIVEVGFSIPLDRGTRHDLMSRHMAVLAMGGVHGVTPYFHDGRRMAPDLSRDGPLGRWRFAGEDELYGLYRAAWRLGDDAPASLLRLRDALADAADRQPAAQLAAMDLYRRHVDAIKREIQALPDATRARQALAELVTGPAPARAPPR